MRQQIQFGTLLTLSAWMLVTDARCATPGIDPIMKFKTHFGSGSYEATHAIATDALGNVYLTGETDSPSAAGRSNRDVFVAKMDSSGKLFYAVHMGGAGNDCGKSIAVDRAGNAYVAGTTNSTDFPVSSGALSSHSSGAEDVFVLKLDSTGHVVYSTLLGGEKGDYASSIAIDGAGNAYVAGQTVSASFPTTAGAYQTSNRGGLSDCFVSKLNSTGSALIYSTLLGGTGLDSCAGLAIDAADNAYVTGTTYSVDFPVVHGLQTALAGTANAFVVKINASGSKLLFSTFLGGSGLDNANAIALDAAGFLHIAGNTSSVDFPTTAGASQQSLKGLYNAFASKMSGDGCALIYSTLVGGSGRDAATSVVVDRAGRAVLGGYTTSPDFPLTGAAKSAFAGNFDAFGTVVDLNGSSLVSSRYVGGSSDDKAYAVAVSGTNLYLAGSTASSDFQSTAATQTSASASYDSFLVRGSL